MAKIAATTAAVNIGNHMIHLTFYSTAGGSCRSVRQTQITRASQTGIPTGTIGTTISTEPNL
jgi:hypothetical protein